MKICVAQIRPFKGDIPKNIDKHKKLIELAILNGADVIFFPELSLTGYEPPLAKTLAINQDDKRLAKFQNISDSQQMTIGVGVPTNNAKGICISMLIFQPQKEIRIYSKKYLHADEEAFFISGQNFPVLRVDNINIGLAICYELSVPEHAAKAHMCGAEIYIASVAKSAQGVNQASKRLTDIANEYAMTVLLSNCVGPSDDFEGAGKTSVWDQTGLLKGQLDGSNEGIIIYDTDTQIVIEKQHH